MPILPLSRSLSFSLSLCLSVIFVSVSLSLSVCDSLLISLNVSLSLSLSVSVYLSICYHLFSRSPPVFLIRCFPLIFVMKILIPEAAVSLFLSLYPGLSSLSLSFSLSVFFVSLSLSLSRFAPPFQPLSTCRLLARSGLWWSADQVFGLSACLTRLAVVLFGLVMQFLLG